MPEFKERPKMDRPKTGPTTIPPKQAAHILKEKYRKQLDQRPEGAEGETADATDKVEDAGRQVVGGVKTNRSRSSRRQNPIKQKEKPPPPGEKPAAKATSAKLKTRPVNPLKTKEVQEQAKPHQPSPNIPRQRSAAPAAKEAVSRTTLPTASTQEAVPSHGLTRPQEAGRQTFVSRQQSRPRRQIPTSSGGNTATAVKPTKPSGVLKERPCTIFRGKSSIPGKAPNPAPKVKPTAEAVKAVKQIAQHRMRQQALARAKQTAKAAVNMGQKVAKAMASLVGSIVGLLGGSVLLVLLIFVAIVGAIASSPFGIFFSGDGGTGGNSVPTVSVSEAVGSINMEYNAKLSELQAGGYDGITLAGQAADWPDVLAVFASRYAAAEDGVDVATLDAERVSKLTATFWDMTTITSTVETIDHPDSDPDDDTDDSWTEYILHITIAGKTAEDMKTDYNFTNYQISALDELLFDRVALSSLAGSLTITNADVQTVVNALPVDISPDRRKAVETALQLVGKVNYFWGGKSYVMGWDSRWGQLMKVTVDGDYTTGTYRPYGLDCTGFIDWALRNAGLPSDGHWYIGTNLTEVSWSEALPGDIALYSDASHVGIIVGRNEAGKMLVCHCSSGADNVVVSDYVASGFTSIGRPAIYEP